MRLFPFCELSENSIIQVENFVKANEKTSTSLASCVRKKSENIIVITEDSKKEETQKSHLFKILGVIDLDYTLYHCIPQPHLLDASVLIKELPALLKKSVCCISGEKNGTDFLLKVINSIDINKLPENSSKTPRQIYAYKMMEFPFQNAALKSIRLSGGEEIARCTENDMEFLHPLQKEYMKEEISVTGKQITDAEVSIMLRQILKNQICLALLVDNEPVAKANTNAIGFNCVQIGGVFTHPLYRRNGYAAALVLSLCNRSIRANRQPVLFVKEKNLPAYTLYKKLGFTECGHYEIVYF